MPDKTSDESIYAELEDIRRRAEIIRDSHCSMILKSHPIPPPPVIFNGCLMRDRADVAPAMYEALVDLAKRVADLADEYAAFYKLGK